jgi:hypothetical protein
MAQRNRRRMMPSPLHPISAETAQLDNARSIGVRHSKIETRSCGITTSRFRAPASNCLFAARSACCKASASSPQKASPVIAIGSLHLDIDVAVGKCEDELEGMAGPTFGPGFNPQPPAPG